jgi:hypothetical protein
MASKADSGIEVPSQVSRRDTKLLKSRVSSGRRIFSRTWYEVLYGMLSFRNCELALMKCSLFSGNNLKTCQTRVLSEEMTPRLLRNSAQICERPGLITSVCNLVFDPAGMSDLSSSMKS